LKYRPIFIHGSWPPYELWSLKLIIFSIKLNLVATADAQL
jgi:hypothetical protein